MTLKECYENLEGNYEDAVGRLFNEALVKKFLFKFLNDKSYDTLCESLEADDYQEAFRAAHTIKGICQNLSFTKLLNSSSSLTEALRPGEKCDVTNLFEEVKRDYCQTVKAIQALNSEIES